MRIELSPIDRLFLGSAAYPIEMSFYFTTELDPERLQHGLSVLGRSWGLIAGTLDWNKTQAWIDSSHPQTLQVETVTLTGEEFPHPDQPETFAKLTTEFSTEMGQPLVRVKVIRGQGASWLTVAMAHCLGDGYSYFLLLNQLVRACRGEAPTGVWWERSAIASAQGTEVELPLAHGEKRKQAEGSSVHFELEQFSTARVQEVLEQAQKETQTHLSFHEWYCAHRWKDVLRRQAPGKDGWAILNTPVDFRRFRKKDVGPLFFGNAVYFASVKAPISEVLELSVARAALKIRQAIREISTERIEQQVASLRLAQEREGLDQVAHWNLFQDVSPILVTNLSSLPMANLAFGVNGESPTAVRYTGAFAGLSVVLPKRGDHLDIQNFRVDH